jgi:hypothetical protein
MARNTTMKQVQKRSTAAEDRLTALQKPRRKAPGTRAGILQDWRGSSSKTGVPSVGIGKSIRDGR